MPNWVASSRARSLALVILAVTAATTFAATCAAPQRAFARATDRANAHPLGNFTINRYSRIEVNRDRANVFYVLDMAEIPAFQENPRIDLDGDGKVSQAERDQYLSEQAIALQNHLRLTANGVALALERNGQSLEFPAGQGGLNTLRIELRLSAALGSDGARELVYRDDNYADRLGWQEIIVQAGDGVTLLNSSVPSQDVSKELSEYPQNLLQNPPAVREATFRVQPATGVLSAPDRAPEAASVTAKQADPFASLIAIPDLGIGAIALALVLAFVWGAAHALSPGHGKTIVAAYLVGSRGTAKHALILGLVTTITHTAGVFTFGVLALVASQFFAPDRIFPWLGVVSGLFVVAIGVSLFGQRLRSALHVWLHHGHEHGHEHEHEHGHDHGHGHTHLPPGADGSRVTWRSLVALGISGGLLPCPSALVVMLSAIALQRVAFGLVLIVVFSLGLASVLTAIGIAFVHAGRWIERARLGERFPAGKRIALAVPVASAAFISLVGLGLTFQALVQAGVL